MEDPEPEQKRIKRIAEHIEDEIDRAQHLPLEELTRHKAAMVHMLQFLSIEEAYAVSLVSRRIYEWFQQNDIWYALAQRWLTPARLAQCEAWVEQVKPKGKRINYLWLLLGEYTQRIVTVPDPPENIHIKLMGNDGTYILIRREMEQYRVWFTRYVGPYQAFLRERLPREIFNPEWTELNDNFFVVLIYEVFSYFPSMKMRFSPHALEIRSKLAN